MSRRYGVQDNVPYNPFQYGRFDIIYITKYRLLLKHVVIYLNINDY